MKNYQYIDIGEKILRFPSAETEFFSFISKDLVKMTAEQQKSTTKGHFLYFRVQKRTFLLTGVL